jgi:hypothetical protein
MSCRNTTRKWIPRNESQVRFLFGLRSIRVSALRGTAERFDFIADPAAEEYDFNNTNRAGEGHNWEGHDWEGHDFSRAAKRRKKPGFSRCGEL